MAAPAIRIELNRSDVREIKKSLSKVKGEASTAIMRAVNRSLAGVKTDMSRETSKILNIKQKRIKKDITIRKANKSDLSGMVSSKGKPVNLEQFGAKQRKKGVSVKVLKSGGRKTIPGAFIFIGKNSNRLVGWRKKTGEAAQHIGTEKKDPNMVYGSLPRKYRLPIESLYGPRIQDITARPEIIRKIEDQAGVRLQKELDHQTEYLLTKAKR